MTASGRPSPMPGFFTQLTDERILSFSEILKTDDLFFALSVSVSDLLARRDIHTFPNEEGVLRRCDRFFDDWFLFAVTAKDETVYGLFKMREQEYDAQEDIPADGDTPGVTVSFIAFDPMLLNACLRAPTEENRRALGMEINRVVAARRQKHHPVLKSYFIRPQSAGAYLIADMYVQRLSTMADNGLLPVPQSYAALYQPMPPRHTLRKKKRLSAFIAGNNHQAGRTVCDNRYIYLSDPLQLTPHEKLALLATHTANTSFHSFAAEVRFHACFLTRFTRFSLPGLPCVYESAIRADMTIDDKEFEGPAPYYNPHGRWILQQRKYHADC